MSLFGVGIMELVLVVMIALIVAGPKRMIQWAYMTGRFIAQIQHTWSKAIEAMQKEFDEAGVDLHLPKDPMNPQEMRRFKEEALKPIREPMEQAIRDYHEEQRNLYNEVKQLDHEVKSEQPELDDQTTASPPQDKNNSFGTWSNRSQHGSK